MVQRRDLVLYILATVFTCGIFGLYWFVVLTDDVNTLSGQPDTSGAMSLLLTIITCGIYGFIWAYKQGEKIDRIKQSRGLPASNGGVLYLILYIFGGVIAYALIQNEVNNLVGR